MPWFVRCLTIDTKMQKSDVIHQPGSAPHANPLAGLQGLIIEMMAADVSREWSGQDLVEASADKLKMGSIYVTLQRMQDKELLSSRREMPKEDSAVVRRLYKLTPKSLQWWTEHQASIAQVEASS
jgi:hypothetical protein